MTDEKKPAEGQQPQAAPAAATTPTPLRIKHKGHEVEIPADRVPDLVGKGLVMETRVKEANEIKARAEAALAENQHATGLWTHLQNNPAMAAKVRAVLEGREPESIGQRSEDGGQSPQPSPLALQQLQAGYQNLADRLSRSESAAEASSREAAINSRVQAVEGLTPRERALLTRNVARYLAENPSDTVDTAVSVESTELIDTVRDRQKLMLSQGGRNDAFMTVPSVGTPAPTGPKPKYKAKDLESGGILKNALAALRGQQRTQ